MSIEKVSKSNERGAEEKQFYEMAESVREQVRNSNEFDESTKELALQALDVTYEDFRNDSIDKSTIYNGKPLANKIDFFLGDRVSTVLTRVSESQREVVFQFTKRIITLSRGE
ncbi:hypothetical protein C4585_00125 [Candidatus Parcubacteria bacterium]|nr:MAG: hypothetical protein C4585_00125 [Candidatus Parcubacteria bacterium]